MKKDGNTYMYMYGILKDLFDVGLKGRLRDRDFISYGFFLTDRTFKIKVK
jgi:hypothetical protein